MAGWWRKQCPKCPGIAECETADNGVGTVKCGPFHCFDCGWTEGEPVEFPDNALDTFA